MASSLSLSLWMALAAAGAAVALAACAPTATLNALVPSRSHVHEPGIAYGPLPRQRMDLYRPMAPAPAGGHPMVVFFYGGSWNRGERADYRFVGEALASRGVLTLVADYRLYPAVRFPDFLHDGAAAVARAIELAPGLNGNPRRLFVMGHSAGAYNAAMLALDARWLAGAGRSPAALAGWIGLAGPYDFLPIGTPEVRPVFHHPQYPAGSQPIALATAEAPPSFIGAARADAFVDPQRNSAQLAARLRALGVVVDERVYARANHLTLAAAFARPLRWIAPVLDDVVAFIERTPPAAR